MLTLFVDSNFFLQCREPSELPWAELVDSEDILILIPRTVQQEIDKHKQAGNSRRARRARKTSSMFREIISDPAFRKVVREADPRVELAFPPLPNPSRERLQQLDLTQPDDRLIDEVLAYRTTQPEADVRLLTHDTNPMLTARQCGLAYVVIPDAWFLPPEPEERDKALVEVRRRLDALEHSYPVLVVAAADANVQLQIDTYPDLTEPDLDRLTQEMQARHPIAKTFEGHGRPPSLPGYSSEALSKFASLGSISHYEPPTKEEISRYSENDYPNWLKKIRNILKGLPKRLGAETRTTSLIFTLSNNGARPAENVMVEFEAHGGLQIAPPKDNKKAGSNGPFIRMPTLPMPPPPPKGHYVDPFTSITTAMDLRPDPSLLSRIARLDPIPQHHQFERDPHAFYWKGGRPMQHQTEWALTCAEFRHKTDPEVLKIELFAPRNDMTTKAAVTCRVTASNLPEPIRVTVPVTISYVEKNTIEVAHRLIAKTPFAKG